MTDHTKNRLQSCHCYIFLLYENIPCLVVTHNNLLEDGKVKVERFKVVKAFSLQHVQCLTMAHDVVYLKTNVKCNTGWYNDKLAS